MKIAWKHGTQHKVDAKLAHQAIEAVRKQNNGEASAEAVVKAAAAKRNPLHPEFTWDDSQAGHQFRLDQARRLVGHLVVVRGELATDRPQRVYEVIRKPQELEDGKRQRAKHVYRTTTDIMADPEMRAELLGRALRELISIRNRFRDLQELAVVLRAIDEVVASTEA